MRAAALVLEAPRRLVPREMELPHLGQDDAILRVEACGLCGTDHELFTGELFGGFAFVPGHEAVGTIETIGERAAERWGVGAGARVAVEAFQSCGACGSCRSGDQRRCERHGVGDLYGFIPVDRPPGLWGGYATHHYLGPDSLVLPVPEGLDPVVATLFNPLGAGIHWGVTLPGGVEGSTVAVLGPGIRGLSVLLATKDAGAAFVMVTGRGPGDEQRLEWAKALGADLVVDVASADPGRELRSATGGGADLVVDVTAKAPAALGQAVSLVRPGGTVVVAGTRGSDATPGFSPDHLVFKEVRLLGALGVDVRAHRTALDLLASGRYPLDELPRRTVGLDGVAELLATMAGEGDGPPPIHGVVVP